MTINTDLLLEIREQITSHPETHDQASWARRTGCGTTHCIAGWAAVLSGARIDWSRIAPGGLFAYSVNGNVENIPDYAARVAGLDNDQRQLFYLTNEEALRRLDILIEKGKNQ